MGSGEGLQAPRRLFVVCGRAAPEGLLQRAFAAVGALEGLRLLREKGCCYVRYERASAALKAIETLHGAVLDHQPEGGGPPLRIRLKVLPAEEPGRSRGSNRGSKGSSGRLSGDSGHTGHTAGSLDSQAQQEDPDNVPPWSRLFVVCPRDADGARIAASMGGYGALEYCKTDLIASKGVAYVKYFQASSALTALEEIVARGGVVAGYKVKVMLAEPKTRRARPRDDSQELESPRVALGSGETLQGRERAGSVPAGGVTPEGGPRGNRLFVVIPRSVTQGLLARLFSNSPGLQNCEIKFDKTGNSKGVAFVSFNTAEEAEHAKDELDGLLVTSKQRIKIMFAEPSNHRAGQVMFPAAKPLRPPPSSGKGEEVERDREPAEVPRPERRDVAAVRDSLANMSMPPTRGRENAETDKRSWEAERRAAQPVSSSDSGTVGQLTTARRARASAPCHREWEWASTTQDDSKLFTILSRPLPDYALHYVFSKFGTIEYVRLLRDKRYGHVKFESAACARNALHELNGTEILGERLKVAVADPVKDSRKRPRLAEGPGTR